jgi:adenosine deaminase
MPIAIEHTLAVLPAPTTGRIVTPQQRAFFRAMPKVELHCHLLGAVREATFVDLVRRYDAPVSLDTIAALYTRGKKPLGVLHALRTMEQHMLRQPEDFARITLEYLEDAAADTVRHAEFFWNPTATLRDHGLPYGAIQSAMVAAMEQAEQRWGISSLLIPAIDREADPAEAVSMVEAMIAHRHPRVAGIGIDYRENDRPPELFAQAYALARRHGLRTTAHAGEFGMPWGNVATALDMLEVDRVDHGYTIVDNPALAAVHRGRGTLFTIVPTNSHYLRTLEPAVWAQDHPIRRMMAMGLALHPNSDDPQLHQISPAGVWEVMYSHLGADLADLRRMMLSGISGSWARAGQKATWLATWPGEFDALAQGIEWQRSGMSAV